MVLTANGRVRARAKVRVRVRVRARAKVRASAHGGGNAEPAHEEPEHLGRYRRDLGEIKGRYSEI